MTPPFEISLRNPLKTILTFECYACQFQFATLDFPLASFEPRCFEQSYAIGCYNMFSLVNKPSPKQSQIGSGLYDWVDLLATSQGLMVDCSHYLVLLWNQPKKSVGNSKTVIGRDELHVHGTKSDVWCVY